MLREALWQSIDALRGWLDTYDLEVWSILHEQDMCVALVKELEGVLEAEESTNEEAEMRREKERYDTRRSVVTWQKVIVEEHRDEGEGEGEEEEGEEEDEDEDEPVHSSRLSVNAKGKRPVGNPRGNPAGRKGKAKIKLMR